MHHEEVITYKRYWFQSLESQGFEHDISRSWGSTLHKNPLRISSVNVSKSAGNGGLVTSTEKILFVKLHLLCGAMP